MKKVIVVVLLLLPFAAFAQQTPDSDNRLATYRLLLGEANDRIVTLSAQGAALEAKVKALEAEKAKAAEPPADKKP